MNDVLKPKIKYYCKFLIQYGINEFKNLLVFISLFSKSLVILSFAVMFSSLPHPPLRSRPLKYS